jgi:hypothetical protein
MATEILSLYLGERCYLNTATFEDWWSITIMVHIRAVIASRGEMKLINEWLQRSAALHKYDITIQPKAL